MLFNSYTFIVFLGIVLIASRTIRNWRSRKAFLLFTSYIFYSAWNPPFVILLWISTCADWYIARALHAETRQGTRRLWLLLSLLVNLGMLGYFKYGTFVLENFITLSNLLGYAYHPALPSIVLPVGISFYTFQTLSYTIDVYRRKLTPWHSFLDYALYVTFFPQLVAGPIVRASEFLPQCVEDKRGSKTQLGWGLSLLVVGLFSKVVIADTFMAPVVEQVFDVGLAPGFFQAWAGTLAFSIQILSDFAGYSTCAIGIAMCFGFSLPDNFRYPYAAVGFSDFWRRWHISLSSWLRDYLYISLGGNQKGASRTYVNLSLTMLIGGLWHGASWLFVIWGGLHGAYLIAERLVKRLAVSRSALWDAPASRLLMAWLTFALVSFTWVFFRASTLDRALVVTVAMLGGSTMSNVPGFNVSRIDFIIVLGTTVATLAFHWWMRDGNLEAAARRVPWWARSLVIAACAYLTLLSLSGEDRAFIYFQF